VSKKKAILILDPAHGVDVEGKQSPDERLQEWVWSRERIRVIFEALKFFKKDFDVISPFLHFDMEPGLRARVDHYNEIAQYWKEVFMISLHVDAAPPHLLHADGWADRIQGTTIFTSRGDTRADKFADELGQGVQSMQPDERYRWDYGLSRDEVTRDLDREANFTVLAGYRVNYSEPYDAPGNWVPAKYDGVLIENGFMTSHPEVNRMLDDQWCRNREDGIVKGIMNWFHTLGLAPLYL
jgi:N-acetylmuramoyl-L-alanine amidase